MKLEKGTRCQVESTLAALGDRRDKTAAYRRSGQTTKPRDTCREGRPAVPHPLIPHAWASINSTSLFFVFVFVLFLFFSPICLFIFIFSLGFWLVFFFFSSPHTVMRCLGCSFWGWFGFSRWVFIGESDAHSRHQQGTCQASVLSTLGAHRRHAAWCSSGGRRGPSSIEKAHVLCRRSQPAAGVRTRCPS